MIYVFCHNAATSPSGGVKMLFEFAQALIDAGYPSAILIPGGELFPEYCSDSYKPYWFETNVPVYSDVRIITNNDLLVLHEEGVWAYEHLMVNKPKYIMINQGAQSSIANNCGIYTSYEFVRHIYDNAVAVITVSPYVTEFVHYIFGVQYNKIYFLQNMVDSYFQPYVKKENKIVFIDKINNLASHLVVKTMFKRYHGWTQQKIEECSHKEVADLMGQAKIFIFFASLVGEGAGLPLMEAAISGCKVIGNSGIGGRYLFNEPLLTEVETNDSLGFIKELDKWTRTLEYRSVVEISPKVQEQIKYLTNACSRSSYKARVAEVFNSILRLGMT